jgi:hypothetical protein
MLSKEPKISCWHKTFKIPETFKIIRKHGSATSQSIIMAAYNN